MAHNNRQSSTSARFRVGDRVIVFRRDRWWWAEFYYRGRQHRLSLKTRSKREASRRAVRLDASLLGGTYRESPAPSTLEEVMTLYLQHLKTEDRRASTIKRYVPELERWRVYLAREDVAMIGDVDLKVAEKYRAERKGRIADSTLYHETILIKQLLNFAAERGYIERNPLKPLKIKRPKPTEQPCYTLEQVEAIIQEGGVYADVYELAAFTGLRIGEIRWLTWRDVELDPASGDFIHVRTKPAEWQPKDGDDRKVPTHPRVQRLLARLPRRHRFVFTATASTKYPNGGRQISDRRALAKLKKIIAKLDIEGGTLHAFRRFFISFSANNGVEPFKLMAWVGHSDIGTVLRYYRLGDAESRSAMVGLPFEDTPAGAAGTDTKQGQNEHNTDVRKAG